MLYGIGRYEKLRKIGLRTINGLFLLALPVGLLIFSAFFLAIWNAAFLSLLWRSFWTPGIIIILSLVIFTIVIILYLWQKTQSIQDQKYAYILTKYLERTQWKYAVITPTGAPGSQRNQYSSSRTRHPVNMPMREVKSFLESLGGRRTTRFKPARRPQGMQQVFRGLQPRQPMAILVGNSGMGKTTALHWLAYHTASAAASELYPHRLFYTFRTFGVPRWQIPIPIVLNLGDYARWYISICRVQNTHLDLRAFLREQLRLDYPELCDDDICVQVLLRELQRSHCLVLLDGLSEIAHYAEAEEIVKSIQSFLDDARRKAGRHNYFVFTTRDPASFSLSLDYKEYRYYVLRALLEREMQVLISGWHRAFTRAEQRPDARRSFLLHRRPEALWKIIKQDQRIRELTENTFMLTILTWLYCLPANEDGLKDFFQKIKGMLLPVVRFELYKAITQVLLDRTPTQKSQTIREDKSIAEKTLMKLAYQIHKTGQPCTIAALEQCTRELASLAYKREVEQMSHELSGWTISRIRDSDLLVECPGPENQLCVRFQYSLFETYFAAGDLSLASEEIIQHTFAENYAVPAWYDLLTFTLIYRKTSCEEQHVQILLQTIFRAYDGYGGILQRNLLMAIRFLLNSGCVSRLAELEAALANALFRLYGDILGAGCYRLLRQQIEDILVDWLTVLPQVGLSQEKEQCPLLNAWREALCNGLDESLQEGAVSLLAAVTHEVSILPCKSALLSALLPGLLRLAHLEEPEFGNRLQLDHAGQVQVSSPRVEAYAVTALHLLVEEGPHGEFQAEWAHRLDWLERLSQYSLEVEHLLTPLLISAESDHSDLYCKLQKAWSESNARHLGEYQRKILAQHKMVRYPLGYLYKNFLELPFLARTGSQEEQSWQTAWDDFFRREMLRARFISFQQALWLRLHVNSALKSSIAEEFLNILQGKDAGQFTPQLMKQLQSQVLLTIISMYLNDKRSLDALRSVTFLLPIHYIRNWFDWLEVAGLDDGRDLRQLLQISNSDRPLNTLAQLQEAFLIRVSQQGETAHVLAGWHDKIDLRQTRAFAFLASALCDLLNRSRASSTQDDCETIGGTDETQTDAGPEDLRVDTTPNRSDRDVIPGEFTTNITTTVLLALYCVCTTGSAIDKAKIYSAIKAFRLQSAHHLTREENLLLTRIRALCEPDPGLQKETVTVHSVDGLAREVLACGQLSRLTAPDIEKLLDACSCSRDVSPATRKELGVGSPQAVAWPLLTRQFHIDDEGRALLLHTLKYETTALDELRVAAAAMLLRHCCDCDFTLSECQSAIEQIQKNLTQQRREEQENEENSVLVFNPLKINADTSRFWRLEDVLFETLHTLIERVESNWRDS